jgi:hypothetical protein
MLEFDLKLDRKGHLSRLPGSVTGSGLMHLEHLQGLRVKNGNTSVSPRIASVVREKLGQPGVRIAATSRASPADGVSSAGSKRTSTARIRGMSGVPHTSIFVPQIVFGIRDTLAFRTQLSQ